ncbi:unnamed protein product [Linum trigynum]|uniref:Uncharacterized protein n=1 Tax=Linum trigynum TaxID=586398 RepID=A0AAV2GMI1_9ROSI
MGDEFETPLKGMTENSTLRGLSLGAENETELEEVDKSQGLQIASMLDSLSQILQLLKTKEDPTEGLRGRTCEEKQKAIHVLDSPAQTKGGGPEAEDVDLDFLKEHLRSTYGKHKSPIVLQNPPSRELFKTPVPLNFSSLGLQTYSGTPGDRCGDVSQRTSRASPPPPPEPLPQVIIRPTISTRSTISTRRSISRRKTINRISSILMRLRRRGSSAPTAMMMMMRLSLRMTVRWSTSRRLLLMRLRQRMAAMSTSRRFLLMRLRKRMATMSTSRRLLVMGLRQIMVVTWSKGRRLRWTTRIWRLNLHPDLFVLRWRLNLLADLLQFVLLLLG